MEMGLAEKKTAIADAETELEDLVEGLTNSRKETFQNMATSVDTGYNGPEAEQWSKLLYFPSPMIPEKNVSRDVMSCIHMGSYEASIDAQKSEANRIVINKFPLLGCDYTFIDARNHYW